MRPRFNQVGLYISIFIVGLIVTGNDRAHSNSGPQSPNAFGSTGLEASGSGRNFTYLALTPKTDPNLRILTRNGDRISLIGLEDTVWTGTNPDELNRALGELFHEKKAFYLTETRETRYGDLSGQVFLHDGTWVQRYLLERGFSRFVGGFGRGPIWRELLAAEDTARQSRVGLWKDRRMKPYDAAKPEWIKPGFALAEGVIRRVARVGDRLYLNFGENWRQDFSAEMSRAWRNRSSGFPFATPSDLENQRVRLRGMVRWYNGPYMPLQNLDQIEILTGFSTQQARTEEQSPFEH